MRQRSRTLALAVLQGPAELLPVSSSAHLRLLGAEDKAAEVAAHAGSALALVQPVRPWFAAITVAPAALAVLAGQRLIEDRLGTPRSMAAGLVAGSAALWWADGRTGTRTQATPRDALVLGLAQATALWPGVSRSAATLAAARGLGFSAEVSVALSREAALPVLAAAAARKPPRREHLPLVVGAALSTFAAAHVLPPPRRLRAFAIYRVALAVLALWQDRRR